MRKTPPVVIVSPDEMNARLLTVLAAPLTKGGFSAPFRVPCRFAGVGGQVALDHLRAMSKARCVRRLGSLDAVLILFTLLRAARSASFADARAAWYNVADASASAAKLS